LPCRTRSPIAPTVSSIGTVGSFFRYEPHWRPDATVLPWRLLAAQHKEGFSFIAEGPLARGFHVAVAGYTLAPEAAIDGIVREVRTALHWLYRHLAALGGDPARIYVSGWSAGGHLAAMLMGGPLVAGGLAISGLFDLEPIRRSYLNEKLGLDTDEARRNSPSLDLPARAGKLFIAYGADELPELKRQSREFGAAWSAHGLSGETIEVADCDHYAVLEQLAQPDGLVAKALAGLLGSIRVDQPLRRFERSWSVFEVTSGPNARSRAR
jgi:arylformamidase